MIILLLLSTFSASLIDKAYSLIPPFLHTSVGEIGNWSIRGQAVSQKKTIHLTSTIGNKNGGLCQLYQTNTKDWEIEIEMSFIDDTFIFTFGPQLCPNISSRFFNALNLSFTPSDKDLNTVNVRLSGPEIFPSTTCSFNYNYHPNKIKIRILKKDTNLTLYTIASSGETFKCLSHKIGSIYSNGYFSLFSFSPSTDKCNNSCITNIYSATFFPLSPINFQQDPSALDHNRKYLDENKRERQLMKMIRRSKMMIVSKYLDEIQNHNGILDGQTLHDNDNFKTDLHDQYNIEDKFSDSLLETKEMVIRAREAISAENLTNFINNKMMPIVDRAAARFERVTDALWNMKSEMLSLWEDVSRELKTMSFDIRSDCELVQGEVVDAAELLKKQLQSLDDATKLPKNINSNHFSVIEMILFVICIVEFIAYIVFFVRYHNKVIRKNV